MVALLDNSGGRRWGGETIAYSAFGVPFGRPGADANGDGTASTLDFNLIVAAFGESVGDPNYSVVADINLDGIVSALDTNLYSGQAGYTLGRGNLSRSPSLAGGAGNRVGYAGYAWEASASKYHVRNRVLDPVRGRWNRRDALGYIDGPTMYAYVSNRAMSAVDPSGLIARRLTNHEYTMQPVCPEIIEASSRGPFPGDPGFYESCPPIPQVPVAPRLGYPFCDQCKSLVTFLIGGGCALGLGACNGAPLAAKPVCIFMVGGICALLLTGTPAESICSALDYCP